MNERRNEFSGDTRVNQHHIQAWPTSAEKGCLQDGNCDAISICRADYSPSCFGIDISGEELLVRNDSKPTSLEPPKMRASCVIRTPLPEPISAQNKPAVFLVVVLSCSPFHS